MWEGENINEEMIMKEEKSKGSLEGKEGHDVPCSRREEGKVPGVVLSASHLSFHLILSSHIKHSDHCCYFVYGETEA